MTVEYHESDQETGHVSPPAQEIGNSSSSDQATKLCSYCGEEILRVAIKCKHCGEHLEGSTIKTQNSETVGFLLLGFPMIACLLCWFWVGSMNLLQDPGSALNLIMILTIAVTASLAAYDANRLGMGNDDDKDKKGRKRSGSVQWFFFIALMWIIGYPAYLYQRKKYGVKNLVVGGSFVAIVFVASFFVMGSEINERIADVQSTFSSFDPGSDIYSGIEETSDTFNTESNYEYTESESLSPSEIEAKVDDFGFMLADVKAETELHNCAQALAVFYVDYGRYPQKLQEFKYVPSDDGSIVYYIPFQNYDNYAIATLNIHGGNVHFYNKHLNETANFSHADFKDNFLPQFQIAENQDPVMMLAAK